MYVAFRQDARSASEMQSAAGNLAGLRAAGLTTRAKGFTLTRPAHHARHARPLKVLEKLGPRANYSTCCPLVRLSHIGSIKDAARDGPCACGKRTMRAAQQRSCRPTVD